MKKNALRIFATASAVVATALIVVLLVAAFGGIDAKDFDNSLARGLITAMSVAYLALMIVTIIMLFVSDESAKEIMLRMGQEGNTRITVGVVKKIAKEKTALVSGVKCKKCIIITNEYGVRLKLSISVKNRDAEEAENELRAILVDAYNKILGFKFHSIELRVKKLVPAYQTNVDEVIKEAEANRPKPEPAQPVEENVGEDVAADENIATGEALSEVNGSVTEEQAGTLTAVGILDSLAQESADDSAESAEENEEQVAAAEDNVEQIREEEEKEEFEEKFEENGVIQ